MVADQYALSLASLGRCEGFSYPSGVKSVIVATIGRCVPREGVREMPCLDLLPDKAISGRGR